jgi:4-hydroxy-3-methylbut-2-en-1-yl diphosphate synthase IspG/GcpE
MKEGQALVTVRNSISGRMKKEKKTALVLLKLLSAQTNISSLPSCPRPGQLPRRLKKVKASGLGPRHQTFKLSNSWRFKTAK